MIQFSTGQTHFDCKGDIGNYTFSGTCVFNGDRLVEVSGGIYIKVENPENEDEELTNHIAAFTYTSHGDDDNFNLSMYSDKAYRGTIWNTIFSIVDTIANERSGS